MILRPAPSDVLYFCPMADFRKLRVGELRSETTDSVSVRLDFIDDSDAQDFQFAPGQYLTLKAIVDGVEVRRSYSICSAPHESELRVGIKKVSNGVFSTYANEFLQVGDEIESLPPLGRFVLPDSMEEGAHVVAMVAGSGITPVLSQIKHMLQNEKGPQVTLFYVNKTAANVMFKEELQLLKDRYLNRFRLFHLLTQEPVDTELFSGRLDAERCGRICKSNLIDVQSITAAYLCGPQGMIEDCKSALMLAGMDESQIHFELFTTASSTAKSNPTESSIEKSSENKMLVQVVLDGITTPLEINGNKTIMDAALDAGLDVPYSCLGGVCCTCRAKMVSGEVQMDVNYALEPDEVAAGFVLTCQSRPKGEGPFVVDFDQQ